MTGSSGTTTRRTIAAVAAVLFAGLLALPLLTAGPANAQARDIANACQGAPPSNFSDRGNAAQAAAIDCIAGYGITQGQTATSFGTAQPVQRDQMATFLARKILLVPNNALPAAPAENQFPCDVQPTTANGQPNPHYENIQRLAATTNPRIAQGGPAGRPANCYGPTLGVTRGQMATFIVRQLQFLKVTLPTNAPDAFTDDDNDVHENNINIVAQLGIAQGTSAGRFQPTAATTRGQMAFFLSRDLSVLVANNKLTNMFTRRAVTALPELVSAAVVSTTPADQVTPTNPVGTQVRYTFDVSVANATLTATRFFVHDSNNVRTAGAGTPTVETGGRSVVVTYSTIATTAAAQDLTLATVDDGAVTEQNGVTNPEGDAPLGSAAATPDFPPGVTSAPDLLKVENARQGATPGSTAVDFVFDQNAFRTTGTPGAFALVMTDNTEVACEAPAAGSTGASGGTGAGGEGTTKFTVVCANPPANPNLPLIPGPTIDLADVARGTVGRGAVASTANQSQSVGATNQNPLQASNDPHRTGSAGSSGPDLVSATFTAGTGANRDAVLYTFDQALTTTVGANSLFGVYLANGTEVFGSVDAPVVNPGNNTQVRVTFPTGTLTNAVGANVRDDAVTATGAAAAKNQQDEVGASLNAVTTRTPGATSGPNLSAVTLSRPPDLFGNPGDFVATYTFDEPVSLQTANQAGAPTAVAGQTRFHLFTSGGGRLTSTACTVGTGTANNTVTCTDYNVAVGGGAATSAQIGSTVLGTVDFAAVFGSGGAQTNTTDRNPEGGRPTTGGTPAT